LIEVCQFIHRGKSPSYSVSKDVPVIAQKCNQKNGLLSLEKALFTSFESLKKYDETKKTRVNDIILNSTGGGTVGRVGIVDESLFDNHKHIVTDSHITTIRVLSEINPLYIYYYLLAPIIFDHVEEKCEGSTNQIELYAKVIMAYPFPLPPKREQDRIVKKIISISTYL
jgi:type I restriction enzyme S subunit